MIRGLGLVFKHVGFIIPDKLKTFGIPEPPL
jgi:hypothetical protein